MDQVYGSASEVIITSFLKASWNHVLAWARKWFRLASGSFLEQVSGVSSEAFQIGFLKASRKYFPHFTSRRLKLAFWNFLEAIVLPGLRNGGNRSLVASSRKSLA